MNRRKFLKWLGVGIAGAAVAPSAIAACKDPWCGSIAGEGIIPHDELHSPWDGPYSGPESEVIRDYADYTNFSEFVLKESIDDVVREAAEELGRAHSLRINRLVALA